MARQFGFAYAVRPNRGWYKKSGNLKYGFEISDGDFILLLDADFAPRPDLLDETLPYFDAVPRGGDRADAAVLPRRGRADLGRARRRGHPGAVLPVHPDDAGQERRRDLRGQLRGLPAGGARAEPRHVAGRALGGPAHRVRPYRLGWRLRYLPIALSTGNCPDNVMAFLGQQYRWCSAP